jgi:hypothetical protein
MLSKACSALFLKGFKDRPQIPGEGKRGTSPNPEHLKVLIDKNNPS